MFGMFHMFDNKYNIHNRNKKGMKNDSNFIFVFSENIIVVLQICLLVLYHIFFSFISRNNFMSPF